MSSTEARAALVTAPFGPEIGGITNQFGCYKTTGGVAGTETTHTAGTVPYALRGQWVEIYVTGGDLHYAFTQDASAEVDRAVAATAGLQTTKVGAVIPDGESRHVFIPDMEPLGAQTPTGLYFVRESSAVGTVVYIRVAGL